MKLLDVRRLPLRGARQGEPAAPAVSVHVDEHEVVALLGAAGSGKTALLRSVVGLRPAAPGQVRVVGRDVAGWATEEIVRLGVTLVPERRQLFAGMSVRDNLLLGGYPVGNRDLGVALDVIEGLGDRLDRLAGSLSGGEQAACALGRALMSRPTLLLIDEISLGLTPLAAEELFAVLAPIAAGGAGVVVAEPEAERVLSVAERGYVLHDGALAEEGTSAVLLAARQRY